MRLKMFPLRCKGDVHQWLSLQYKRRSTLEEVWGWKCECESLKVKVWKCESYLVEAGEDWDEVDWMVVPPQAEVLCGRPTWHGGRVSETIQNCLRFIYVKIITKQTYFDFDLDSHEKGNSWPEREWMTWWKLCIQLRTWENCTEATRAAEYAGWGIPGHDKNLIKEELDKFAFRKSSPSGWCRWLLLN